MLNCHFWIIGQHTFEAMKEIVDNPMYNDNNSLLTYCAHHKIVVVWSLNKEKVMYMSKVFNIKIHENMPNRVSLKTSPKAEWFGTTI